MAPALTDPSVQRLLGQLQALRTELVDLAFTLDRQGRAEAADVALQVSARVGELCGAGGGVPPRAED